MSPHAVRTRIAPAAILFTLLAAVPALAGPPLLCHPFDIGQARSLPWDGSTSWFHGRADYNVANLVRDTEALLTTSTPVIVRMETIRRAALYASLDRSVASALYTRFGDRVRAAERSTNPDPLALLDAALLTETFRQLGMLGQSSSFRDRAATAEAVVGDADGRLMLAKVLSARPDDASIRFAAALMVADRDRRAYEEHAQKARAGASHDALLARNLHYVN
jgi:hypothetical protein